MHAHTHAKRKCGITEYALTEHRLSNVSNRTQWSGYVVRKICGVVDLKNLKIKLFCSLKLMIHQPPPPPTEPISSHSIDRIQF